MLPIIFATINGRCQRMTPKKGAGGVWSWNTSWTIAQAACTKRYHRNPNYDGHCENSPHSPFFSVDVVIDFKDDLTYMKKGEKNILGHLAKLLNDPSLADVSFKVKNETLKAHTIIVSAGSPVLSAMFQSNFVESRTRIVEIKDTKPAVFKQLLQYLYTGQALEIKQEGMAHDLLVAADKYGVESLKEECANVLIKNLKVETAAQTLITAHLHSSSELYEATLTFMSKHGKAICSRRDWMELIKNYPELCFQVI